MRSPEPPKPPGPLGRAATYDDLRALPEHVVGEIVGGELHVSPRPAVAHAYVATGLTSHLFGHFNRPSGPGGSGWWFLIEPELHLGGDVLVPDVAGWRRERLPRLPRTAAMTVAPDWVCEVLSTSTARVDWVKKARVYARERVGHLWYIDPAQRVLHVRRLADDGEHWLELGTFIGADVVVAEPFTQVTLDLGSLWIDDDEPEDPGLIGR